MEDIKTNLKIQEMIDIGIVTIKKNVQIIATNTYIMTFDMPTIHQK